MRTPDYQLSEAEKALVYEPAEDTFLLLDVLEGDCETLARLRASVCVEVGSGSGVVSAFAARLLPGCTLICTDLNVAALECSQRTAALNCVHVHAVAADLCAGLEWRLRGAVDVLLFNPPYVPTDDAELRSTDVLTRSWAGGADGRAVIERFLPLAARLLSRRGVCYLVALAANNLTDADFAPLGLRVDATVQRQCGRETLRVLRLSLCDNR